jgi:hypothetical protein
VGRIPCDQCELTYSFTDEDPPCGECFPGVHEFNVPFYTLYAKVSNQYLMGPNGAIGINMLAVDLVLDYFNVAEDERLEFQEKVQTIASKVLSVQQADAERRAKQK